MFNLCQRISWCVRVSQIIGSYCSVGTALARYTRVPWFDSRLRLVLTNLTFGAQCKYPLYDIPWGYALRVLRTLVKISGRISQGEEICQRVSKYESQSKYRVSIGQWVVCLHGTPETLGSSPGWDLWDCDTCIFFILCLMYTFMKITEISTFIPS